LRAVAFELFRMTFACCLHNCVIKTCIRKVEKSCDSSVGIALGYELDDRGSRVRFPVGAGNLSLHHHVQNGSGAHTASYLMGTRGSFSGVKRPGREADYSPPSSAEVKNEWSYTSTAPVRLHGVVLSLKSTGTTLLF
jgi:hypothetical protein